MWVCERCGEESQDQFQACWKCGAPTTLAAPEPDRLSIEDLLEGSPAPAETSAPTEPGAAAAATLLSIREAQRAQSQALDEIRRRVGCLWAYMIFSLITGAIAAVIALGQR